MNKSRSKIRHIKKSNILLEQRTRLMENIVPTNTPEWIEVSKEEYEKYKMMKDEYDVFTIDSYISTEPISTGPSYSQTFSGQLITKYYVHKKVTPTPSPESKPLEEPSKPTPTSTTTVSSDNTETPTPDSTNTIEYPEYNPPLKKTSFGYDPKGKILNPFDNKKHYGGFYPKYTKKMKEIEKYYYGYDDQNGNHIDGEIETAKKQNRKINFLKPFSDDDISSQQTYNNEFDQYLQSRNQASLKK